MKTEQRLLFKLAAKGNSSDLFDLIRRSSIISEVPDVLTIRDEKGRQLTHVAAKEKNAACLNDLIKKGCKVDSKCNQGNSILHYACKSASLCCAIVCLQMGNSLRETNLIGETPLDVVPESKEETFGRLLRKAESEVNERAAKFHKLTSTLLNVKEIFKQDCINPVPVIEEEFLVLSKQELAKGPNVRYCKGYFKATPILVKHLTSDTSNSTETELKLLKETVLARNLRHSNILLLLGISLQTPTCSLMYEYPTIGFLHRILFQSTTLLCSTDVFNIARDISNALQYLHTEGYVHCSVASFSVTLSTNMTAKLCNLEHMMKLKNSTSISHLPSLYPYMSIEQLQGKRADQSNDIYGLGVVLFECLTREKMQDVNASQKRFNEKDMLSYRMKYIPESFESSIKLLIEECFASAEERPSASQIHHWIHCLLEGCITAHSPSKVKKISIT